MTERHIKGLYRRATRVIRGFTLVVGLLLTVSLGIVHHGEAQATESNPMGGSPVSWWSGEGNASDRQNGNHGTLQNGAAFGTGARGQAFRFDGVDDYVEVAHNANLDPGAGSFTVDAWIKMTAARGTYAVVSKYECGGTCPRDVANSAYTLVVRDGQLVAFVRDTNKGGSVEAFEGQVLVGSRFVADGQFHHVMMVRDSAAGELRLWVDGDADACAPLNPGASGVLKEDDGEPDPFLIGAQMAAGLPDATSFFPGLIDEVKFFTEALTVSGIQGACSQNLLFLPIVVR